MLKIVRTVTLVCLLLATTASMALEKALRVCADPGNMPLSNQQGEGYQNRIAEVLAAALDTHVTYFWRPSIERGMFRSTLDADECDVYFDMPTGLERVLTTTALYRTTFVLAYRNDRDYAFKGLDDPRLKDLKVGVFQMSTIRSALNQYGVKQNLKLHFISHDGDLVPAHQPSYQVQQVVDGELDVAAIWGPMAGFYKTMKQAPVTLQPVNTIEHLWEMEYDMSLAVRKTDEKLKAALEAAMVRERDKIRQILVDYGVPLVACETCVISGDLPAHGPYQKTTTHNMIAEAEARETPPEEQKVSRDRLDAWLAEGADVNQEFNNAVIAGDVDRAAYLLGKGADINARDAQGYPPLVNAARRTDVQALRFLLDKGANTAATDVDGWNALMFAAWRDDAASIDLLAGKGADLEVLTPTGVTPLALAAQHAKSKALVALVKQGAKVNVSVGGGGYTPLMLAVAGGSVETVELLLAKGADVNAANKGGITALMIAAARDQPATASALLRNGARPDTTNQEGRTAARIAEENGASAVLEVLGRAGKKSPSSS